MHFSFMNLGRGLLYKILVTVRPFLEFISYKTLNHAFFHLYWHFFSYFTKKGSTHCLFLNSYLNKRLNIQPNLKQTKFIEKWYNFINVSILTKIYHLQCDSFFWFYLHYKCIVVSICCSLIFIYKCCKIICMELSFLWEINSWQTKYKRIQCVHNQNKKDSNIWWKLVPM